MSLPLTPQILEAAYEYLRATPPFRSWGLPIGADVKFRVTRHRDREGDHGYDSKGVHVLRVSSRTIGHNLSLLLVTGHEMAHMRQGVLGLPRSHNAFFHRLARRVCQYHGWDPKVFIGPV